MSQSVKWLSCLLGLLVPVPGSHALAQERTVYDGVFTVEQAAAGQSVYNSQCRTCHDHRFYRDTLRSWHNQPLLYLWDTVVGTMPADNPGSLMLEEYTDVIAFILQEQGFPAGEQRLDPDEGMEQISIKVP